ncbi:hypothetical protein Tco_1294153 [Tanacetum coccineum]
MPLIPFLDEVKVVRQEEADDDIDNIPTQDPDVNDDLIQPLIPQPTPPDNVYVVTDIDSIWNELLEEFRDEILDITVVDEEADFNPTRILQQSNGIARSPRLVVKWKLVVADCNYGKAGYPGYAVVRFKIQNFYYQQVTTA